MDRQRERDATTIPPSGNVFLLTLNHFNWRSTIWTVGLNYAWMEKIAKPCEWYSWRETRRMIAEAELPWTFALISFGSLFTFGFRSTWSALRERENIWTQTPHIPYTPLFRFVSDLLSVCFSQCFFLPDSHACARWRVFMLHAIEGTQLHRCVACLAVFSICLEQPPL